jgi:hypothetical protein
MVPLRAQALLLVLRRRVLWRASWVSRWLLLLRCSERLKLKCEDLSLVVPIARCFCFFSIKVHDLMYQLNGQSTINTTLCSRIECLWSAAEIYPCMLILSSTLRPSRFPRFCDYFTCCNTKCSTLISCTFNVPMLLYNSLARYPPIRPVEEISMKGNDRQHCCSGGSGENIIIEHQRLANAFDHTTSLRTARNQQRTLQERRLQVASSCLQASGE